MLLLLLRSAVVTPPTPDPEPTPTPGTGQLWTQVSDVRPIKTQWTQVTQTT